MTLNRRLLVATLVGGSAMWAQTPAAAPPSSTLKVGDKAPDFTLPSTEGGTAHLADYIGKSTVVLAFFPAAFTGG
jgi:peroxiredoxin